MTPPAAPSSGRSIDESELRRRVEFLASDEQNGRDEGTAESRAARAFIVEELSRCGVLPGVGDSYEQPITTGEGVNVVGIIPGRDDARADRHVLLSAHYDHIGDCDGAICNGADDNAAGVALVVGVACELAKAPPPKSVLVVAWDSEEPPTFLTNKMGSAFFAKNPTVPLDRIDVAVVLDLVGADAWNGFPAHFALGAELSPEIAAVVDRTPVPEGLIAMRQGLHLVEETVLGHQPWSDYDAFRKAKRPFVFLSNGQNKRYHTGGDEIGSLNFPKMALEAQYLLELATRLAETEGVPTFDSAGSAPAIDLATTERVLQAALSDGGLLDQLGLDERFRELVENDREAVEAAHEEFRSKGRLSKTSVQALRHATQRLMCLAGPYPAARCSLF